MQTKFMIVATVGLLCSGFAVEAAEKESEKLLPEGVSASVAVTSEYFFRGVSQTDDSPAGQGPLDYAHSSGFYAGADGADVELDVYAGFSGEIVEKLTWTVGAIYYAYPRADGDFDYDYVEATAGLSYDFGGASAGVTVNYSPDNFDGSGEATYVSTDVEVTLGKEFTLGLHGGYQWIEKEEVFGLPDYLDFMVSIGTSVGGFDVTLAYTDTDHSESECSDACGQGLLTVSRSF